MEEGRTPGEANEVVVIDGNEITIKPSVEMALHFSKQPGYVHGVMLRCINLDVFAIAEVLRLGNEKLSSTDPKFVKRLHVAIYEAGLREVGSKCCNILSALANGGRVPREAEDDKDEDPGGGPLVVAASE